MKTYKEFISEHCGCVDNAVGELEDGLKKLDDTSYDSIDELMRKIMKKHKMTAKELHNAFVDTHGKIPDEWIKQINKRKK
jgi:ABC-type proline/glycine betaine transport system substrate-binding protein